MKICVLFCVLSLTSSLRTSPTTVGSLRQLQDSTKGTHQTLYFSESTTSIALNCSCRNQLVQWRANRQFCKLFWDALIVQGNNSLCNNCTATTLTLTPPFVPGPYLCIGTGKGPSCFNRWTLQKENLTTTTLLPLTTYTFSQKKIYFLPIIALLAFVCVITANYILIFNLDNFY